MYVSNVTDTAIHYANINKSLEGIVNRSSITEVERALVIVIEIARNEPLPPMKLAISNDEPKNHDIRQLAQNGSDIIVSSDIMTIDRYFSSMTAVE